MTDPIPPLAAASPRDQAELASEQRRRAAIAAARVPVRFLRDYHAGEGGGWVNGEVAGFDPGAAEHLERAGIATRDLGQRPLPPTSAQASGHQKAGGENVAVLFRQSWEVYNKGERAGFPPDTARWLCTNGIAEPSGGATVVRRTLASIRAAIVGG